MDTWSGTIIQDGTEPRIEIYYPPREHVFQHDEAVRVSIHALASPTEPLWWQQPAAAWLFWQVTLEIDQEEVGRWGADWIADNDGQLNLTVALPFLAANRGRHEAYITVMPGVVTTTPCTNKSVSPGCPGYTPPAPRNPIAGGTHSDHDAYHGHEHHDAYHAHHLHHHEHDKATTFMTGHGIIFYT